MGLQGKVAWAHSDSSRHQRTTNIGTTTAEEQEQGVALSPDQGEKTWKDSVSIGSKPLIIPAPSSGPPSSNPGSSSNTSPRNEHDTNLGGDGDADGDEGVIVVTKRQSGIAPLAQTQVTHTPSQHALPLTSIQHTLPLITTSQSTQSLTSQPTHTHIHTYTRCDDQSGFLSHHQSRDSQGIIFTYFTYRLLSCTRQTTTVPLMYHISH